MSNIREALLRQACPKCGSSEASEVRYSDTLEFRGLTLDVEDLLASVCSECAQRWFTQPQTDSNHAKLASAYRDKSRQLRTQQGMLSGKEITNIRNALKLTQADAAGLFGESARNFQGYEEEELLQSSAMDRLLRLTQFVGDRAVEFLRQRDQSVLERAPQNVVSIVEYIRQSPGIEEEAEIIARHSPVDNLPRNQWPPIGPDSDSIH
jgi:HTH-type transcriptional regulator / antitoxin MqsA